MFDLTGRNVLITGASGGIGAAIASCIHAAGATVGISGTRLEPLQTLATELGENAHVLPCNLSDPKAVVELPKQAGAAMGSVDILVNNAGITRDNLLFRMGEEDWDDVIATNLSSCFHWTKALGRPMTRKRSGRIVNVSSVVGLTGNAGQANYSAAKAGIIGFTKSLAREFAGRSVTVNAVAPGFIETDMTSGLDERVLEAAISTIPLKRFGTVDDIAEMVAFICSEKAGYVTGQVFTVDGGMVM